MRQLAFTLTNVYTHHIKTGRENCRNNNFSLLNVVILHPGGREGGRDLLRSTFLERFSDFYKNLYKATFLRKDGLSSCCVLDAIFLGRLAVT